MSINYLNRKIYVDQNSQRFVNLLYGGPGTVLNNQNKVELSNKNRIQSMVNVQFSSTTSFTIAKEAAGALNHVTNANALLGPDITVTLNGTMTTIAPTDTTIIYKF